MNKAKSDNFHILNENIDRIYLILATLGGVVLLMTLFHIDSEASKKIFYRQVLVFLPLFIIFGFKRRIPKVIKSIYLNVFFFLIATLSVFKLGIAGVGFPMMSILMFINFVSADKRFAIVVSLFGALYIGILGLFLSNGYFSITMDLNELNTQSNIWINIAFINGTTLLIFIVGINGLHGDLNRKLKSLTQELKNKVQDLSEKQSFLKIVLNTIPQRVIWKNKKLEFMGANNNYLKDADINDESEIIGKKQSDLPWSHYADVIEKEDLEIIQTKKIINDKEMFVENFNGKDAYLKVNKVPLLNNEGEVLGVLGTFEDITKEVQYQNELKRKTKEAEVANEAKSSFIANMSHEIRTPLNGIIGLASLMKDDELSDIQKEKIEMIIHNGDLVLELVNNILDLSKIESGKLTLEKKPFNILGTVQNLANIHSSTNTNTDLHFNLKIDDLKKLNIVGDELRISQILNNLLSNSFKFTKKGEVSLEAMILHQTQQDVLVGFKVSDTGIGIDKKHIQSLFESFNQLDVSRTREYGGSGLGLAIVKKLVNLMNGEVKVISELGKGTTLSFEINFTNEKHISYTEEVVIEKKLDGKKVLVAEDNQLNQNIIQRYIEKQGGSCVIAKNGELALELFDETFDLILLDIQMPKLNGEAVCVELLSRMKKETPILAFTANALSADIEKYMTLGFTDVLSKPLQYEEFARKLSKVKIL